MRSSFTGKELEIRRCVNALKEWTGKARATVIFESTVDEFTHDGLFNKVKGKPDVAIIGFTTDGDVFGGFYSVAVTVQDKEFYHPDMFIFSFESRGRCATPQRFVVKEKRRKDACVKFWKANFRNGFVYFGVFDGGGFYLGNEKSKSCCWSGLSISFEDIEDQTLTGKNDFWVEGSYHHCTRLVAVQLE